MLRVIKNNLDKIAVLYIIIYAILSRLIMLFIYTDYSIYPDSAGYIDLGRQLSELDLSGYSGKNHRVLKMPPSEAITSPRM